jgi:hypothetical protein
MAALPGMVIGSSFISGSGTSTLTGTPTVKGGVWCGFAAPGSGVQDSSYITSINYNTAVNTGAAVLAYQTVTFTVTILKVGATGYQYLDGEFDVACADTPPTGTLLVTLSTASMTLTNFAQATMFFEKAAAVGTQPDYQYCAPGAVGSVRPVSADAAAGSGCTGSSIVDPTCVAGTPNLCLPNDGDLTVASWAAYNMVGAASTMTCNTVASLSTFTPALNLGLATDNWYGVVSFAFTSTQATATASGTFTLTLTGTQS